MVGIAAAGKKFGQELMTRSRLQILGISLALGIFFTFAANAQAKKEEGAAPQFKYKGGTEDLSEGCDGNLEITPHTLTFRCETGFIEIPYSAITSMQYRSNVTKKVR